MVKKTMAAIAVGALMSAGAVYAQDNSGSALAGSGTQAVGTFNLSCEAHNCSWLLSCTTDGAGFRVATADGGNYGDVWMANLIRPNGLLIQATSNQDSWGAAYPVGTWSYPASATANQIYITVAQGNSTPAGFGAGFAVRVQSVGGGSPSLNCNVIWADPYGDGTPMPVM